MAVDVNGRGRRGGTGCRQENREGTDWPQHLYQ
jgi:hypothetical protein